jgi:hypothetical protein
MERRELLMKDSSEENTEKRNSGERSQIRKATKGRYRDTLTGKETLR